MTQKEERRNMAPRVEGIMAFLLITFGVTWSVWGVACLLGLLDSSVSGQIIVAVGAFAPALAAFIVRKWITREGFADAGLRPHLVKKLPYYFFAWLWPLVGVGAVIAVASALGIVPVRSDVAPALVVGALGGALI